MSSEFNEGFIQPTLVRQLQSILEQYPDDGQILKELIQNADDAGATVVKFLYDDTQYESDETSLVHPDMAKHMGPALYAYNDAVFTEFDWRGIRMLHDSVKADDPMKVGRFGLGFKSVFHMTDLPGLMSGRKVGYLDPLEVYFENEGKKTSSFAWDISEELLLNDCKQFNPFCHDIFNSSEKTFNEGKYDGTIFRFPLRKNGSAISKNTYSREKVNELLHSFEFLAHHMLLFLRHLEKIEIYEKVNKDSKPKLIMDISIDSDVVDIVAKARKRFNKELVDACQNKSGQSLEDITCSYHLKTKFYKAGDNENELGMTVCKNWLITQYFACSKSKSLETLLKETNNLPLVGMGVNLDETQDKYNPKGQLFCFLPLQVDETSPTGLNVHVNGYFAINHDRRHLKFPSADQRKAKISDNMVKWNICLIEQILPLALLEFVRYAIKQGTEIISVSKIYNLFPDEELLREYWKGIASMFYQLLGKPGNDCFYTEADNGKWVSMKEVYLLTNVKESYRETIKKILLHSHYAVCEPPESIVRQLEIPLSKVTAKLVHAAMQNDKMYVHSMSEDDKQNLVAYMFESKKLASLYNIPLFQTLDGSYISIKSSKSTPNYFLETPDFSASLLPSGCETRILKKYPEHKEYMDALQDIAARETTDLHCLTIDTFPQILKNVFQGLKTYTAKSLPANADMPWLKDIWQIMSKHPKRLKAFEGLPIVPVTSEKWMALDSTKPYLATSWDEISESVFTRNEENVLEKIGVVIVDAWKLLPYKPSLKDVKNFIAGGALNAVMKLPRSELIENVGTLEHDEKCILRSIFCNIAKKDMLSEHKKFLKGIPLVECYRVLTSQQNVWLKGESISYGCDVIFPISMPHEQYIATMENDEAKCFARLVGIDTRDDAYILTRNILPHLENFPLSDIETIMVMILDKFDYYIKKDRKIKDYVAETKFILTKNTVMKPSEIFDPHDKTNLELFRDMDKFPVGTFRDEKHLVKLKSHKMLKKISSIDMIEVAKYINEHSQEMTEVIFQRSQQFFTYLNENHHLITDQLIACLKNLNWIPICGVKPRSFPQWMSWFGEENKLYKPGEAFKKQHASLVGCIKPVLACNDLLHEKMMRLCGLVQHPPLVDVKLQLRTLIDVSVKEIGNGSVDRLNIESVMKDIYTYLSECGKNDLSILVAEIPKCIWVGEKFVSVSQVTYKRPEVDASPHVYYLPDSFKHLWDKLFRVMGVQETISMPQILQSIKMYHSHHNFDQNRVKVDLEICLQILNKLKEYPQTIDSSLLIPVQSSSGTLELQSLHLCTYSDAEWLKKGFQELDVGDLDGSQKWYIVHESISMATAKALGIPSLMSKYLDVEELNIGYGQTEPLTRRLHQILEGYQDGSAVFTELIQNADDAQATTISFIYDTRNFETTDLFIDPKMKELDGPAIMCYNNAVFSDSDFENIIELSGETKKDDADKIGRYGLGFNAVYNLTDVPNFISSDSIVMFDPHMEYIGKVVREPGIRLKLKKHSSKIKRLKDQFQPFQGLFGCDLQAKAELKPFSGTLFRFPLRSDEKAKNSKISNLCYSKKEVKSLFKMLEDNAAKLLLFTQYVREINIYKLEVGTNLINMGVATKETMHILKPLHTHQDRNKDQWKILDYAKKITRSGGSEISSSLVVKVKEMFKKKQKSDVCNEKLWLISNTIGEMKTEFKEDKEFLPVGSIALELVESKKSKQNKALVIKPLVQDEGQLFCFLPLPIKHGLPVHINGCFSVSSDRKHLSTHYISDKMSKKVQWNKYLMEEVLPNAYIHLLEQITIKPDLFENPGLCMFDLFPQGLHKEVEGRLNMTFMLQQSFYKRLIQNENLRVMPSVNGWTNFQHCIMLGDEVDTNSTRMKHVRPIMATVCSIWYNKHGEKNFVDCSSKNRNGFNECGFRKTLLPKFISIQKFYADIFLPNIGEIKVSDNERDDLLIYAVTEKCLHDVVRKYPCIPARNKQYLKPEELVDPNGELKVLYDSESGPFPVILDTNKYVDQNELSQSLLTLGMRQHDLEIWEIIECAKTVSILDREMAVKCSKCLLNLIADKCLSEQDLQKLDPLKKIPFIAKLNCPKDWKLQWGGNYYDSHMLPPCKLFSRSKRYLVGCSEPIADIHYEKEQILNKVLGLDTKEPEPGHLMNQLHALKKAVHDNDKLAHDRCFDMYKTEVYEWLNYKMKDQERAEGLITQFRDLDFIAVNSSNGWLFVKPEECAVCVEDLDPYLYKLPRGFEDRYKHLCNAVGIKYTFDVTVYLQVLQTITDLKKIDTNGKDIKVVANIVKSICEGNFTGKVIFKDLHLPSNDGEMIPTDQLYYQHSSWIKPKENVKILHESISSKYAQQIGIKPLSESALDGLSYDIPCSEEFGQYEDLTNRIKRILTGYPLGIDILKELIQNADDAGATEMEFILDTNRYNDEKVFTECWKELQGPSLIVCNNASFSDSDIEGIQKLGEGSKERDAVTTGRYGVGFNSVYHLTDVPSFLTTNKTGMQKLCIFDPHRTYVSSSSKMRPGSMFLDIPKARSYYPDVFSCFENYTRGEEGTVFRFPLRTERMASQSKISDKSVGTDEVRKLLKSCRCILSDCLLFLRNIHKISIQIFNGNEMKPMEKVTLSLQENAKNNKQEFIKQEHQFRNDTSQKPLQVQYIAEITKSSIKEPEKWLVVQQVGHETQNQTMTDLLNSREFSKDLLPKGGVACQLSSSLMPILNDYHTSYLFCLLPLPIQNISPMHVNAHFALDSENRRNLWNGKDDDPKHIWNKILMEEVVSSTFISALNFIQCQIPQEKQLFGLLTKWVKSFLILMPCMKEGNTNKYFHYLERSIYLKLSQARACILPVITWRHDWNKPDEAYPIGHLADLKWHALGAKTAFLDNLSVQIKEKPMQTEPTKTEEHKDSADIKGKEHKKFTRLQYIQNVLRNCNFPLIDIGNEICKRFCYYDQQSNLVSFVTSNDILSFFKQYQQNNCQLKPSHLGTDIKDTPLHNSRALKALLTFCDLSQVQNIEGLPLLLRKDKKLTQFSSANVLLVSYYNDIPKSKYLLFADSMFNKLSKRDHMKGYLKEMSCKELAELLPHVLAEETLGEAKQVEITKKDDILSLICSIWCFVAQRFYDTGTKEHDFLKKWCIVPVSINNKLFLLPPARLCTMIHTSTSTQDIVNILQKLQVPQIRYNVLQKECLEQAVGDCVAKLNHPHEVLRCIGQLNTDKLLRFDKLSKNQLLILVQYFMEEKSLLKDQNCCAILQNIPIYETIWGTNENLTHHTGKVFTLKSADDEIISTGSNVMKKSGKLYIVWKSQFEPLFKKVGVKVLTFKEYYSDHVFPVFAKFEGGDRLFHLLKIKRFVEDQEHQEHKSNSDARYILQQLKTVPIMEDRFGKLQCASKFYNPHDSFFSTTEVDFPPEPYSKLEWINFMEKLGLHVELTSELVIKYATDIAVKSVNCDEHLSLELQRKSEALLQSIFTDTKLFTENRDIDKLKDITFLTQLKLPQTFKALFESKKCKQFICLNGSISSTHWYLIWTQMPVLPEWACGKLPMLEKFGVVTQPKLEYVVQNLIQVCKSQQQLFLAGNFESSSELNKFVIDTLKYLNENHQKDEYSNIAESVFLPVNNGKIIVKPIQITMKIDQELAPYLYKTPIDLLPYTSLLFNMGVTEEVTKRQYKTVLDEIRKTGELVGPNDINIAIKATEGFFLLCEAEDSEHACSSDHEIYVLTNQKRLIKLADAIFVDEILWKNRISKLHHRCMADIGNLWARPVHKMTKAIGKIAIELRPSLLSEVVTEEIDESSVHERNKSHRCLQLEKRLTSNQFQSGITRLIKNNVEDENNETSEDIIKAKLQDISFWELAAIKTYLLTDGEILSESEDEKQYHIQQHQDKTYQIYLSKGIGNIDHLHIEISNIINQLLQGTLSQSCQYVVAILNCPPHEIETVLNKFKINQDTLNDGSDTLMPKPGDYVPLEYHHLLCESFLPLSEGEFVAYEVFDPLNEFRESILENSSSMPVYIYAKVIAKIPAESGSTVICMYKVDTGEEIKDAHASELYSFSRQGKRSDMQLTVSVDQTDETEFKKQDIGEIKKEIKKQLKDAWKQKEAIRKKILKRLMLKWHPDKNPDNTQLATVAFQYIQQLLRKLENNMDLSDEENEETSYSGSSSSTFNFSNFDFESFFKAHFTRRSRTYGKYRGKRGRRSRRTRYGGYTQSAGMFSTSDFPQDDDDEDDESIPRKSSDLNPQPAEAYRWLLQAEFDLAAVYNDIKMEDSSYEWACFKAHQAAEKALKATQFAVHADLHDNEHNLSLLCDTVSSTDTEIQKIAEELEELVGGSSRMRYPNLHDAGMTPHDSYDQRTARNAEHFAKQIVEKCKSFVNEAVNDDVE